VLLTMVIWLCWSAATNHETRLFSNYIQYLK